MAIVLTKSTTELVGCALTLGFFAWSFVFRKGNPSGKLLMLWITAVTMIGLIGFALYLGPKLFALIGKDATLTGRDVIWQGARYAISQRPWLGYGFQGFWNDDSAMSIKVWATLAGWKPIHAHNGILELLVEEGRVGALLFLLMFVNLVRLVLKGLWWDSAEAWWSVSWLILVVFKGLTEPVYMQLDVSVALMVFSSIVLAWQADSRAKDGSHHSRNVLSQLRLEEPLNGLTAVQ